MTVQIESTEVVAANVVVEPKAKGKKAPAAAKPLVAMKNPPKTIANPTAGSLEKAGVAHYVTKGGKQYRIAAQPAKLKDFNPKTATPRQKRVQAQASWSLAEWQKYCIGKADAKAKREAK